MLSTSVLVAAAAGVGCGALNALVGGGSLVSFPVLMALGVPPVNANATNTVALAPGYCSAAVAQRHQLVGQRARVRPLLLPVAVGGASGAGLLLVTSDEVFRLVVPLLLALATASLAATRPIQAVLRRAPTDVDGAHPDARWLPFALALVAVYGGFFGAGIGIMLLAVLAVGVHQSLPRSNALKQVLSIVINLVAAAVLVALSRRSGVRIEWGFAAALAVGNVVGGQLGGMLSRRMDAERFRWVVVAVGTVLTVVYAVKEYA